ncbi:hypothetical protein FRC08_005960, partial [Ceratobasidium sp. 394]
SVAEHQPMHVWFIILFWTQISAIGSRLRSQAKHTQTVPQPMASSKMNLGGWCKKEASHVEPLHGRGLYKGDLLNRPLAWSYFVLQVGHA